MALLYFSDRFHRESWINIGLAYFAGIVSVIFAGLAKEVMSIEAGASPEHILGAFWYYLGPVATLEELSKVALFFVLAWNFSFRDFSEPYDAMVYLGAIGVGFAVYEDFSYIFQTSLTPWKSGDIGRFQQVYGFMVWQRAFPGHILFNMLGGYFIGQARFLRKTLPRIKYIGVGVGVAIISHTLFNLTARFGGPFWLSMYVISLSWVTVSLRDDLLNRSPYNKIKQLGHTSNLIDKWNLLMKWNYPRDPGTYRDLELSDGLRRGAGLFPLLLSIFVLYPLLIAGLMYIHKGLVELVSYL